MEKWNRNLKRILPKLFRISIKRRNIHNEVPGGFNIATRALVLQALANNISSLKEIADFANVTRSTASHHLNELIRLDRVRKIARGEYILLSAPQENFENNEQFSNNISNFEKRLPGGRGVSLILNHHEKNILIEILKKENKYTPFSASQIARNCGLSTKSTIDYAKELEKKDLITMEKKGRRWLFVPTDMAIKGFSEYFSYSKTGKNLDRSCSKKVKGKSLQVNNTVNQQGNNNPTFEECLSFQVFNAHRIILQLKILRCDHKELERTAWVFGPKSIHRHLPEAFVFKSYDASGHILNVLPKKPFIFKDYFEFEDQMGNFMNQLIKRLRDYDIIIDLSQPAEIKLEHQAIENDEFARRAVRKGLLYFKRKSIVHGRNGELIQIVTAIDKSSAVHIEWEGNNAAQYAQNYGAFVEDVAAGRIDTEYLKDLPVQNEIILANIQTFDNTVRKFDGTVDFYTHNIESHIGSIQQLGKNAQKSTEATDKLTEAVNDAAAKIARAVSDFTQATKKMSVPSGTEPPRETKDEDVEEETITYNRSRAKIPISVFLKSNLRHKNSKSKTRPFRYIQHSGNWELKPIHKGRIRKTRIIYLPEKVERGSKLKWWLQDQTICLRIQGVNE